VAAWIALTAPRGALVGLAQEPTGETKPSAAGNGVSPALADTSRHSSSTAEEDRRLHYQAARGRRRLTAAGPVLFLQGGVNFLVHGDMTVTAHHARYYERGRFAWIVGEVHAVSESLQLWADSVRVEELTNVGRAYGHVRMETADGVLGQGRRGVFWRDDDRMALAGQARIIDSTFTLEGDSLLFDRKDNVIEAFGGVKVVDTRARTMVTGEHGLMYRETGVAFVDSLPHLQSQTERGSTADVVSRWMSFDQNTEHSRAIGQVGFHQGTTVAHADTADFFGRDLLVLTGNPQVEQGRRRMTGRKIRFHYDQGELQRIEIFDGASLIDSTPDSLSKSFTGIPLANELHGDSLWIDFDVGEIRRTRVSGHAQSVYLPDDQSEVISVNEAEGDSIEIDFSGQQVRRVTVGGTSQGNYRFLERASILRLRARADTLAQRQRARLDSLAAAEGVSLDSLQVEKKPLAEGIEGGRVDYGRLADTVHYEGDETEFRVQEGRIHIHGTALVSHGELTLTSQDIYFDTTKREMIAEGDPMLIDTSSKLVGEKMGYLFDYRTGAIQNGITRYEDGFYYGKHVRRVDDETLLVSGGSYTSCDLEHPHYHFSAKRMKVKIGKSVVGRQITAYISDMPVFLFPFFFKKIDSGRHSGIIFPNVNLGISSREGRYIRDMGYYWATNEYTDFTFKGSYNERRDLSLQIRNRYNVRYGFSGGAEFTWTKSLSDQQKGTEWKFLADHRQPELFDAWNLTANVNLTSNNITNIDPITGDSNDLLPTELRSNLTMSRSFASGTRLNTSASRTQYVNSADDDPLTDNLLYRQTLPNISLSFKSRPLLPPARRRGEGGGLKQILRDMTFGQSYRGDIQIERREVGKVDQYSASGNWSLTYNPQFRIGPFNFTSSGSFSESYQRRDEYFQTWATEPDTLKDSNGVPILDGNGEPIIEEKPVLVEEGNITEEGSTPSLSWRNGLSTNLYGIFNTHIGALRGIKHKLSFSATHSWRPKLGDKQAASQSIGLTLGNEFSFKYATHPGAESSEGVRAASDGDASSPPSEGEQIKKLERLLAWNLRTAYRPDAAAGQNWDNISSTIRISPGFTRVIDFTMNQTIDPYHFDVLATSVNTNLRLAGKVDFGGEILQREEPKNAVVERLGAPADTTEAAGLENPWYTGVPEAQPLQRSSEENSMPWQIQSRASITNNRGQPTRASISVRGSVMLPISWNLEYSSNFDIQTGDFTNQAFSLSRDIHCWRIEFRRTVTDATDFSFRIYLKGLPDIQYRLGNQSAGGYFNQLGSY